MCIIVLGVEYCFDVVGVVGWWGQFFLLLIRLGITSRELGHRGSLDYLDSTAHLSVLLFYVGLQLPARREIYKQTEFPHKFVFLYLLLTRKHDNSKG